MTSWVSFTPSSYREAATVGSIGLKAQLFTKISEKQFVNVFPSSNNKIIKKKIICDEEKEDLSKR